MPVCPSLHVLDDGITCPLRRGRHHKEHRPAGIGAAFDGDSVVLYSHVYSYDDKEGLRGRESLPRAAGRETSRPRTYICTRGRLCCCALARPRTGYPGIVTGQRRRTGTSPLTPKLRPAPDMPLMMPLMMPSHRHARERTQTWPRNHINTESHEQWRRYLLGLLLHAYSIQPICITYHAGRPVWAGRCTVEQLDVAFDAPSLSPCSLVSSWGREGMPSPASVRRLARCRAETLNVRLSPPFRLISLRSLAARVRYPAARCRRRRFGTSRPALPLVPLANCLSQISPPPPQG